ncbi:MAG: hypothetical protein JRH12_05345 [Deltaproteobacteria bacterium]|jgi:NAD-dependent SIR2 family protein deacetylase|nr:hypothetical protein [Deltaproteobacteria bacterium]MBW2479999.1 hypothetical protein [Deltaproteobacteria bacterium]
MDDWEMECIDCGWRGMTSELTEETDDSGDRSFTACPECGGTQFKKRSEMDGDSGA